MPSIDLEALRAAVRADRYIMTTHAKQRMGLRHVTDADMKHVVTTGDRIEDYPDALPCPKCLLMAQVGGEPLYVSCAFDGRYAYIITVHRYDPEVWADPWTRKRK
jgi:Domain of unknown function (DUF4258)